MGCYINHPDVSKEVWLSDYGPGTEKPSPWHEVPEGHLPVCLVDNGGFTAAAIAFDEEEFEAFKAPDERPMRWFVVPIAPLKTVSDIKDYLGDPHG